MSAGDIAARVQRGAALLDEKRPRWWREIDLASLDIGSRCGCIVGQLTGLTEANARGLVYEGATRQLGISYSAEIGMGFEAPSTRDYDADRHVRVSAEYDALTAAWRDLITARRGQAGVPA